MKKRENSSRVCPTETSYRSLFWKGGAIIYGTREALSTSSEPMIIYELL